MQRIFQKRRSQAVRARIHNRDAHAQCSEIDARNNGQSLLRYCSVRVHFPAK